MLEQRVLVVRPRAVSALRTIVDGDSGKLLGFASWEEDAPRPWWCPFSSSVLAVHEHEDEPLLFTIRRAWSLLPRREVRDAEGHPVGSLLGRLVYDRFGRLLTTLQDNNGSGVFRTPEHRTLAELTATLDGLRVFFSADIAGEPFVKMLLLAAVLSIRES